MVCLNELYPKKYHISLGSVSNILKRKREYVHDYKTNQNQQVKRKFHNMTSQKLDEHVYEWFVQQHAKNIPISGPIFYKKRLVRYLKLEVIIQDNSKLRMVG